MLKGFATDHSLYTSRTVCGNYKSLEGLGAIYISTTRTTRTTRTSRETMVYESFSL